MKKLLTVFIILLFFISRESESKVMNSLYGYTKQQISMQYGIPYKKDTDGAEGEVWLYAKILQGYINGELHQNYKYTYLYFNKEGKMYYWRTKITPVPPQQIILTIK
jgi:hypothetical protein